MGGGLLGEEKRRKTVSSQGNKRGKNGLGTWFLTPSVRDYEYRYRSRCSLFGQKKKRQEKGDKGHDEDTGRKTIRINQLLFYGIALKTKYCKRRKNERGGKKKK